MADEVKIENPEVANVVLPKLCIVDQSPLKRDEDGSITGLGSPCWYCEVEGCGYIEPDESNLA